MSTNWKQTQIKRINTVDFIPRRNMDVVRKLLTVFKHHIGEENKVSAKQLFRKVYKAPMDDVNDLQLYLLSNQLNVAMSFMRLHTNCFIVRNHSHLWVAKSQADYDLFNRVVKARIKGLENLRDRCGNAIQERWYEKDFVVTKQIREPKDNPQFIAHDVGHLEAMSL